MVRVFKTRSFARWMRKTRLDDSILYKAVVEMTNGLIDADLGGGVVKKRIAIGGHGKRGGARTLIATNRGDRWIFLYGFEKSEKENISAEDLAAIKRIASTLLLASAGELDLSVQTGELQEVRHGFDK